MNEMKIKLSGQLITDKKPTIILISNNPCLIQKAAKEYLEVYPEIFLSAEWGNFKPIFTADQKIAISNLLYVLQSPITNLLSCF